MPARKTVAKFFDPIAFLPPDLYAAITDVRIERPAIVQEEAERRKRRSVPAPDGALVILAADHPGRNVLNVKDDPLGMADRHAYLARILRVLSCPGIDGIMGTPDLVEDLFILTRLIKERGGSSLLDDRLLVGCMNRGGLRGTALYSIVGDGCIISGGMVERSILSPNVRVNSYAEVNDSLLMKGWT